QKGGASVAIYHTAGVGKRLFPLTASELNNKSAVKIPATIGRQHGLSILESVIYQTAKLGDRRKGRLSVFWGDQIFVPGRDFDSSPTHHIDILSSRRAWPNEQRWDAQGFDQYGLIIQDNPKNTLLVEKISYSLLKRVLLALKNPKQSQLSISL